MNIRTYILRKFNSFKIYKNLYRENPSYALSIFKKRLLKISYPFLLIPILPILLPLIVILRLINPLFSIRMGNLESEGIGHFSLPVEIYLNELDLGIHRNKRTIDLWYLDKVICNKALLNKWKVHLIILPRFILKPFHILSGYIPGKHLNEIPFRRLSGSGYARAKTANPWQSIDIHDVISQTNPRIIFSDEEVEECESILEKAGFNLSENFVCVSVRDSAYHNDSSLSSHRNTSINDYLDAFSYLNSLGYTVVRMGAKVTEELDSKAHVFDYAMSGIRTDLLDLFLISKCSFFVGTGSGLDMVCSLFRKTIVLINFSQLGTIPEYFHNTLVLFRRMKINNRMLSLDEIFLNGYESFTKGSDFEKAGISLVANSEDEIRSILLEAHERKVGLWNSAKEDVNQLSFRSYFKEDGKPNYIRANIGSEFIKTLIESDKG